MIVLCILRSLPPLTSTPPLLEVPVLSVIVTLDRIAGLLLFSYRPPPRSAVLPLIVTLTALKFAPSSNIAPPLSTVVLLLKVPPFICNTPMFLMPPPSSPAVLLLTVTSVIVNVPRFLMAPPSSLAVLLSRVTSVSDNVPLFSMAPLSSLDALLLSTTLFSVTFALAPINIPPPSAAEPFWIVRSEIVTVPEVMLKRRLIEAPSMNVWSTAAPVIVISLDIESSPSASV